MSQKPAKHQPGANHPCTTFSKVEPMVNRSEPLPVVWRVLPPSSDKDDFERFRHATILALVDLMLVMGRMFQHSVGLSWRNNSKLHHAKPV